MTSAPADLLGFRANVRAATGLGAVEVGIVGDGAHQRTGGFHEGKDVLTSIGRYHGPASANVGSSGEDYSARQARDRNGLTNSSSASDVGDNWPRGGRAAWLRWNNLLYAEMRDRPGNLPALRAINVSLDGKKQQRYDQLHRGDGLISSTDSVTTHTHLEFWRDTEGNRASTLARITQLMQAAISGTPESLGDDMANTWTEPLTQGTAGYAGQQRDTALAFAWQASSEAAVGVGKLLAAAAADEVRDKAMAAAITALATNGGVDEAPIVAAVNEVRDEARAKFAELLTAVQEAEDRAAAAEAEVERLRAALHTSAQAEADATADAA